MSTKATSTAAKPMSKTEVMNALSEKTGLSKKEVSAVLEGLAELVNNSLSKKGSGVFNLPGLAKFKVVRKPATKARKGINPFTKEEVMFKAKPARRVIKVRPLKALKDMAK